MTDRLIEVLGPSTWLWPAAPAFFKINAVRLRRVSADVVVRQAASTEAAQCIRAFARSHPDLPSIAPTPPRMPAASQPAIAAGPMPCAVLLQVERTALRVSGLPARYCLYLRASVACNCHPG